MAWDRMGGNAVSAPTLQRPIRRIWKIACCSRSTKIANKRTNWIRFFKDLKHPVSKTIGHPIHVVFETLFRKYVKINTKLLCQQRTELEQHSDNTSMPGVTIFNMLDKYEELTTHAESPIILPQNIDIGYTIFKRRENWAAHYASGHTQNHLKKNMDKF